MDVITSEPECRPSAINAVLLESIPDTTLIISNSIFNPIVISNILFILLAVEWF